MIGFSSFKRSESVADAGKTQDERTRETVYALTTEELGMVAGGNRPSDRIE